MLGRIIKATHLNKKIQFYFNPKVIKRADGNLTLNNASVESDHKNAFIFFWRNVVICQI